LIYFAVVFDKSENKEDENCKNSTVSISFCLLQKFRTMGGAGNGGTRGGAGDGGGEGCTSRVGFFFFFFFFFNSGLIFGLGLRNGSVKPWVFCLGVIYNLK
jgi:hypothetical protein